jgi:hypothetical protein
VTQAGPTLAEAVVIMNSLKASLSAAIVFSSLFVASSALADEEPIDPQPVADAPVDADASTAPRPRDRMRVGALVGVGFPRPLNIEAFAKVNRFVGVGAEYGFLPRVSMSGAELELKSASADLRVFPFGNGLFIGVRGGRQWIDAKASGGAGGFSGSTSMTAATWFINPRVGFLHTFSSGITLGIDAGVQIPVSPETAIEHSHPALAHTSATRGMQSAANLLGNETTPTVDLLRVGFLF